MTEIKYFKIPKCQPYLKNLVSVENNAASNIADKINNYAKDNNLRIVTMSVYGEEGIYVLFESQTDN